MKPVKSNRKIVQNTILLYIRSGIVLFVNLLSSRLLLKILGVEDFGIYNLVGGIVGLFSMISSNLQSASQRFITYALGKGNAENLRKVFTTSTTLHLLVGLVMLIILELAGGWLVEYKLNIPPGRLHIAKYVYHFSVLSFFVSFVAIPYSANIIAHEKMSAYAYITIFDSVIKFIAIVLLSSITLDRLLVYSCLHFVAVCLVSMLYICYAYRTFEESNKIQFSLDKCVYKEMFVFIGWNFVGSSALVLRNQGIDIVLNIFFNVIANAARGVANQVQSAIHIFVGNFTTAINPQLTAAIAQNDYQRADNLIFHGSRMAFFMTMVVAVPIIVLTKEILDLWLVSPPAYSIVFVRLTIILLLLDTMSRLIKNGILAHGNIRNFQLSAGGVKLMALPISYLIFKQGGAIYVGYIVCIVIDMLALLIELYFAHHMFKLDVKRYINKCVLHCYATFAVAILVSFLFYTYVISNFIVVLIFSIMMSCVLVYLTMNNIERNLVKSVIMTKFRGK